MAEGEPRDRPPRRPGGSTPLSSEPPATHREAEGSIPVSTADERPPETPATDPPADTERPAEETTHKSPAQPKPLSKEKIDAILKRFAPEVERHARHVPEPDEPTIKDAHEAVHDAIAFEETVQLQRRRVRDADERIGALVAGRYKLLKVLGEGGMGTVFEASHIGLGKRVAVKLLSGLHAGHDEASARFLREARASSAVESEHIVHVFDVGEDLDVGLYMVMELLKGHDLADTLAQHGRLRPEAAAGIAWQVSLALERAHNAGIVHRDLKPANVFLTPTDDGAMKVRVLDFGIAKLVRDAKEVREGITRRGSAVGTPQYMAPEQAQALPTVDSRADLYSLGALLFECVTGKPPYPHLPSYEQTILKIMTEPPPRASSLVPELPPALDQLIADLMLRSPDARPASAAVVRERLAQMYSSLPSDRLVLGAAPRAASVARAPERTSGGVAVESERGRSGKSPSEARRLLVAAAVVLALGAGGVYLRGGGHAGPAKPAPTTAPKDTPQAIVGEARRELREGRSDLACAAYQRASDAEPSLPGAALEASLCHLRQPQLGRVYFRRAWAARAGLGEAESGLLDALEAKFQRDPVDNDEWMARIRKLSERFPSDPRLHTLVAHGLADGGQLLEAHAELQRALELDPNDPKTLEVDADTRAYLGDFAGAQKDLDQCLGVARGAIGCIEERAWIDGEAGLCAAVEAGGRRILSVEPSYAEGISFLANALVAEGSPLSAIRDLLRRRREMLPEGDRAGAEHADELQLAMLGGDLVTAEKLARGAYDAVHDSLAVSDHGKAARVLVAIEEELGRASEASQVAAEYLGGRDAWEPSPRLDDWAMADEPTPLMLAARLHAGDLTAAAFERERARTVQRWESRVVVQLRDFVWIHGFAAPTETPSEATIAVHRLASFEPLPPFTPLTLSAGDIGRTLYLAGRIDDALPQLERATKNCFPLDRPIEHTRAYYFLGMAREAKGDKAGACAAYGVVRDRWGGAKPGPATAQKVLVRLTALGCHD